MIKSHILGFPRIGENRELKFALESFWKGESDETQLQATASSLRKRHWQEQIAKGLDFITVGDFSLYDQTADHIQLLGCEPERFHFKEEHTPLSRYFTMVRGQHCCASHDHEPANTFALEMTKWFDTNYHYMVPEFTSSTGFSAHTSALLAQVEEAKQFNHPTKVSLIGPLTFLYLGKSKQTGFQQLDLLHALIPVYVNILKQLAQAGVEWVQLDEPILGLDLSTAWQTAFEGTYQQLHNNGVKILLGTYFSSLNGQISAVCKLPIDGLHIDCIRAPQDLKQVTDWLPNYKVLSLGLIDGRNIWKSNLDNALSIVEQTFESGKGELWLAPSCSLLHVPYQFAQDQTVHAEVKPWLAGAIEKLSELRLLKLATNAVIQSKPLDAESKTAWLTHQSQVHNRASSRLLNNPVVKDKLNAIAPQDDQRNSPFATRQVKQQDHFKLPLFPTTTIGSFPQTANIRGLRARLKKSEISQAQYWDNISQEIRQAIEFQERIGLDVLVHGEAERNDMVEFFGERLDGFTFSANGWVQSYGSRCVKPPILFGDVSRPAPMTVDVAKFAQSLSEKPVKGMLTGPVTILQWSFVRNDQARSTTALQIALAIREEVQDLEAAGIGMIQIDEPAFREGLPLRQAEWKEYLEWAARAFRISASGVQDNTQIHTHMCYSEFNDILADIAAMDADVITIETSRSDMELLRGFGEFKYPNEIGPGVYDIHSPRIPHIDEVLRLFRKAIDVIPAQNLWINPDCGLKTRGWKETEAALCVMVDAAKQLRQEFSEGRSGTQAA